MAGRAREPRGARCAGLERVMTRPKVPNRWLRGLLAEAGWTEDFLARQVNAVAAESGVVLRLDRRSVTHWLAGRRPRSPVPELIAEAFSRGLRRPVGLADTGLGGPAAAPAGRGERDPGPGSQAGVDWWSHAEGES